VVLVFFGWMLFLSSTSDVKALKQYSMLTWGRVDRDGLNTT